MADLRRRRRRRPHPPRPNDSDRPSDPVENMEEYKSVDAPITDNMFPRPNMFPIHQPSVREIQSDTGSRHGLSLPHLPPPSLHEIDELGSRFALDPSSFRIREFRLQQIEPNSKIVLIGHPASGKSYTAATVARYFAHQCPVGIVFSGTETFNHNYTRQFRWPSVFVYNEYDEQIFVKAIVRQEKVINSRCSNPWLLLLFDDVCDQANMFLRKPFKSLFKNGRHMKILAIMILQYSIDLPRAQRGCTDYVFIFNESNEAYLRGVWENYAGAAGSYKQFVALHNAITATKYTAMVIDSRAKSSTRVEDRVFWYRAPPEIPQVQFGCAEMRQWHNYKFNTGYRDAWI